MIPTYRKNDISEYIGKRFGHLTVIGLAEQSGQFSNQFLFKCDCGKVIQEQPHRVIRGKKGSCGKCKYANLNKTQRFSIEDYIGMRSEKLTVIGVADKKPEERRWRLHCLCDCGKTIDIFPYQFKNGGVKSCGCLRSAENRDGRSLHPLYGIWNQMMGRCYRESDKHYHRYGGRGIAVCDEWHDFWSFARWSDSIGGRPEGYEIDRIDNDGDYCPENCRWATRKQQMGNTSANAMIEYGEKRQSLAEWADEYGLEWNTLWNRIKRGWAIEKAITTPVKYSRKKTT